MNRPDLIVFDLDGTLIDSRTDLANAINVALTGLGLQELPKETIAGYVGDGIDALIRRCLTKQYLNLFERAKVFFSAYYRDHCLDYTDLLPGVREILQTLSRESQLAVLTNKSEPYAHRILEGLGVAPLFSRIVGERKGTVPKPDPTMLRGIMNQLKAVGASTLMVGDGKNDILVAQNAGCRSCGMAPSEEKRRHLKSFHPDALIGSMDELPGLFNGDARGTRDGG